MASQATAQSKKRLALAIVDFLQTASTDGSIEAEDVEQLEIAQNCITEAFKVDAEDKAAMQDAVGGQNLLSIYSVYEKLKGKSGASPAGASSSSGSSSGASAGASTNEEYKAEAEKLKGLGNDAMKAKDFDKAIEHYTKALDIVPLNPIYLSNRAAAYSGQGKHEEARNDAEMAVAADPKYSKAWSRLGLARYVLGDAKGAMEAYKSGIEAEGNGGSAVMKKGYETAKKRYEDEGGDAEEDDQEAPRGGAGGAGGMPDLSSLAGMLGGMGGGGGGGGGGMPDVASMMSNPMVRQMAQNMMQNPQMLEGLMNNPRVAEMAAQFGAGGGAGRGGGGGGGGMPDIASLMQDPNLAEMARNFMGGMGGQGGAGRGGQ